MKYRPSLLCLMCSAMKNEVSNNINNVAVAVIIRVFFLSFLLLSQVPVLPNLVVNSGDEVIHTMEGLTVEEVSTAINDHFASINAEISNHFASVRDGVKDTIAGEIKETIAGEVSLQVGGLMDRLALLSEQMVVLESMTRRATTTSPYIASPSVTKCSSSHNTTNGYVTSSSSFWSTAAPLACSPSNISSSVSTGTTEPSSSSILTSVNIREGNRHITMWPAGNNVNFQYNQLSLSERHHYDYTMECLFSGQSTAQDSLCIPQLDGNVTITDSVTGGDSHDVNCLSNANSHTSRPHKDFNLNLSKQMSNLKKHVNTQDFSFDPKDSNKCIVVNCNTGFYALVVKPFFSHYSQNYTFYIGSTRITCTDVTTDVDESGSEYCRVVKLNLYPRIQGNGNVAIHLFHSQQKLHVQGGSFMTSGTTAPMWVYNNVLEGDFVRAGKVKRAEIDCFNTGVTNLSTALSQTSSSKCKNCHKVFKRNCTPIQCKSCLQFFHKTSCLSKHSCHTNVPSTCTSQSQSTSNFIPTTCNSVSLSTTAQPVKTSVTSSQTNNIIYPQHSRTYAEICAGTTRRNIVACTTAVSSMLAVNHTLGGSSGAGVGSSGAGVGSSGAGVGSPGAGVGSSGAGVGEDRHL